MNGTPGPGLSVLFNPVMAIVIFFLGIEDVSEG
jgi:hypothetical protein